jgi:hypothetical protein
MLVTSVTSTEGMNVKIQWDYPIDNGDQISAYIIKFKLKNGSYYEDLTNCDGSNTTIVNQRYCLISMSSLSNTPYNFLKNDPVIVIGKSKNIKGWADNYSDDPIVNALVEGIPDPVGAPYRGGLTTFELLQIAWNAITANT